MPAQDRVRTDQQQESAEPLPRQVLKQSGQNRTVDIGEHGSTNLTLKHQQLMPQDQYLNLLLPLTRRQQPQHSKNVGGNQVDQAQ